MRHIYILPVFTVLAVLMPWPYGLIAGLIAAALWLKWGEQLLVWFYGLVTKEQLEPLRQRVNTPFGPAAFDGKYYFFFWQAEPTRSTLGIEAENDIRELWAHLALVVEERLCFVQLLTRRYAIYVTRNPRRLPHIESTLKEFFVLRPTEPWTASGPPPRRLIYAPAAALLLLSILNPSALPVAIVAAYLTYRGRRRLRHAPIHWTASHARDIGTNRTTLETAAAAEASAIARQERWAVCASAIAEAEVEKKFVKAYDSLSERAKTVMRMSRYWQLVERMTRYDERPILLAAYASGDAHTALEIRKTSLGAYWFWGFGNAAKAMSGDLCRFPILYGGKLLRSGREVTLARDKYGRPVVIDVDSLPTVHAVILGPSGMGKSWTVATWSKLLAEIGVRLVFVDPHGDYVKLAQRIGAKVLKIPGELPVEVEQVMQQEEAAVFLRRLALEFGFTSIGEALQKLAPDARYVKVNGHVVYDLSSIRDEDVKAFLASLLIYASYAPFVRAPQEQLSTVIIVDEARILMRSATMTVSGLPSNALLDTLRALTQGGRKYGFSLWLVVQTVDQIPQDLLRTAAVVLALGGPERVIMPLARALDLSRDDVSYLLSATTPRESGGYAVGVLLLSPRNIKYHVRIPLDRSLK